MFNSMKEVKEANEAIGNHWFSEGAMAFFNSVIETELIGRRYFVTSERMELSHPKQYTIREACEDGTIETVGDFQEFDSLDEATARCERLALRLVQS